MGKYCGKCGAEMQDSDKFCVNCGAEMIEGGQNNNSNQQVNQDFNSGFQYNQDNNFQNINNNQMNNNFQNMNGNQMNNNFQNMNGNQMNNGFQNNNMQFNNSQVNNGTKKSNLEYSVALYGFLSIMFCIIGYFVMRMGNVILCNFFRLYRIAKRKSYEKRRWKFLINNWSYRWICDFINDDL